MAGFLPQHVIDEIRDRADIVDIISHYVPLKKSGRNHKALCPFHEEKTPSFSVNAAKQIYHCFGCGKGGNVFSFIMEFEKVPFPQAVEIVADRVGYKIPLDSKVPSGAPGVNKKALYEVNARVARRYHEMLRQRDGGEALLYLQKRGISEESIEKFYLGFAPDSWDFLTAKLKDGKSREMVAAVGLIIRRENETGYYDRFRNRAMFPIYDAQERVVGFGGRALDDSEPKYLNSPETSLFSKSRNLYGLNWARPAFAAGGPIAVVEGYTDVIMAHQNGVNNVVATLGTALTAEHVRTLKRFTGTVIVVYDSDEAGRKASQRGIDMLLRGELDVRVAVLPEGQDPCDFISQNGGEAFKQVLAEALDFFDYKIAAGKKRPDFETVSGQSDVLDDILRSVANFTLRNLPKAELLLKKLAESFGISEASVRARLGALTRRNRKYDKNEAPSGVPQRRLEDCVIELMLAVPPNIDRIEKAGWIPQFQDKQRRDIAREIVAMYSERGRMDVADLMDRLQDAEKCRIVAELESYISDRVDYDKLYEDCSRQFENLTRTRWLSEQFERVGKLDQVSEEEQIDFLKKIEAIRKGESNN
ncbi:MAG: DNA primase [Planctomycetota bacterium]|nr:MAG: DNA primase [Planctomycetota bacterium]